MHQLSEVELLDEVGRYSLSFQPIFEAPWYADEERIEGLELLFEVNDLFVTFCR